MARDRRYINKIIIIIIISSSIDPTALYFHFHARLYRLHWLDNTSTCRQCSWCHCHIVCAELDPTKEFQWFYLRVNTSRYYLLSYPNTCRDNCHCPQKSWIIQKVCLTFKKTLVYNTIKGSEVNFSTLGYVVDGRGSKRTVFITFQRDGWSWVFLTLHAARLQFSAQWTFCTTRSSVTERVKPTREQHSRRLPAIFDLCRAVIWKKKLTPSNKYRF